jgi:hypothetical protein
MNNKSDPIDLSNSFYSKYSDLDSKKISNESNFFEYIFFLIKKFVVKVANVENDIVTHIKNSINGALSYNGLDKEYWAHVINCQTEREHLINLGVIQAEKFLDKLEKLNNNNNELINNSNIIENTLETSTSTNNSNDETILETSTSTSTNNSNDENDENEVETSTNNNITINQETALENSNTIIQNSVTITS